MIFNTYPINNNQPVPQFIKNFYDDLRNFITNSNEFYENPNEAIDELLNKNGLSASISLNTITVNNWLEDNTGNYVIICWQDEYERYEFIEYYIDYKSKPTQQPYASYRH